MSLEGRGLSEVLYINQPATPFRIVTYTQAAAHLSLGESQGSFFFFFLGSWPEPPRRPSRVLLKKNNLWTLEWLVWVGVST